MTVCSQHVCSACVSSMTLSNLPVDVRMTCCLRTLGKKKREEKKIDQFIVHGWSDSSSNTKQTNMWLLILWLLSNRKVDNNVMQLLHLKVSD